MAVSQTTGRRYNGAEVAARYAASPSLATSHAYASESKGFQELSQRGRVVGPFTCIAGVNGVGKSNLFDAIMFLSGLADRPLMDRTVAFGTRRIARRN